MTIAPELLRRIVEGALLASGQPLSEDKLLSLIDEGERPEKAELKAVLEQIAENCAERGFELKQVASGWRFQVPEDLAPWVNRLWEEKAQKYSRATLETLAIIAYRQPITRGDIEEIRGVAVSSHIVKTLSERGWIKVVGQRDVPGKPSLYATTKEFLDYFNLRTLDDLPTLAEIRDIDSLNQVLDLEQQGGTSAPQAGEADAEAPVADTEAGEPEEGAGADTADTESVPADSAYEELPAGEDSRLLDADIDADVEGQAAIAAETDEVAEADFADSDSEAAADAATTEIEAEAEAASETEAHVEVETEAEAELEAEDEQLEVGASDAEQETSLAAGLPPSSLFASDDAPDSVEETSAAEMATSDEDISEDADVDGETREEAQVEKTTL
ncbi:SMC-Scp complex subunit ScpB [Microbulbifer marinus]|uniref:Condensin subunit ScpB n=1 Tax=Microbulbifer marinus TaxID=658218 RepID=A0A1H3WQ67_9GAMM|nr:SMC-Scp complex subunit ScpB [Microbulbifer marinus]SDZ88921.1 condensin subunit ScpB [Microbulbifer marinus]